MSILGHLLQSFVQKSMSRRPVEHILLLFLVYEQSKVKKNVLFAQRSTHSGSPVVVNQLVASRCLSHTEQAILSTKALMIRFSSSPVSSENIVLSARQSADKQIGFASTIT